MRKIILIFAVIFALSTTGTFAFTFGAAGDFENGTMMQATVNAMDGSLPRPDFMIALGDLSYGTTANGMTAEESWCNKWNLAGLRLYPIAGNHDTGESGGGDINQYIQKNGCNIRPAGLVGDYGKRFYFDYPTINPIARFIFISPGVGGSLSSYNTYGTGGVSYNWTRDAIDDARNRQIKWIIVSMHKNHVTPMEKNNEVGNPIMNLLINQKRVDLIMQGHEHGYARSKQLLCTSPGAPPPAGCTVPALPPSNDYSIFNKGAGSIIHIIGTGGKGLRSLNTGDPEMGYFATAENRTNGAGLFTVTADRLSFRFVKSGGSGNLADDFVINDCTTNCPPTPSVTPTVQPTATPRPPSPTPPTSTTTPSATPVPPGSCGPTGTGRASMTMTGGVAGTYKVWSRLKQANGSGRYWLQINSDICLAFNNQSGSSNWIWSAAADTVNLPSGNHVLTLIGDTAGMGVDRVIFSEQIDCVPTNFGDNCLTLPSPTPAPPTSTPGPSVVPSPTSTAPSPTVSAPSPTSTQPSATPTPGDDDDDDGPGFGSQTMRLIPIADARTLDETPNTNYGSSSLLRVNSIPSGEYREVAKAYLKFNISALSGKTVTAARLRIHIRGGEGASDDTQNIRLVENTGWSENTINHNNAPAMNQVITTFGNTTVSTWKVVSLPTNTLVSALANGKTVYGLGIENCLNCRDGLSFDSKESAFDPVLVVEYR